MTEKSILKPDSKNCTGSGCCQGCSDDWRFCLFLNESACGKSVLQREGEVKSFLVVAKQNDKY